MQYDARRRNMMRMSLLCGARPSLYHPVMSVFAILLHTKNLHRVSVSTTVWESRVFSLQSRGLRHRGEKGMESRSRLFHTDQYVRTRMNQVDNFFTSQGD